MSVREPTPEQRAAIEAEGEVLVSASAGSGKTFVMVEKLIRLILTEKADVSSVLAVTFTNLAAAEMKERLRQALVARINTETDAEVRKRLKEQLSEIATSDISTVHSFCTNVIRRYFYESGLAGNFRIADDQEADKLKDRAVSATFDALLEGGDEQFLLLCRAYAGSRGFSKLKDVLLRSYNKVVARAEYSQFLRSLPQMYNAENFSKVAQEVYSPVKVSAQWLKDRCEELIPQVKEFIEAGIFTVKHEEFLAERRALAERILACDDVFGCAQLLGGLSLSSKPRNTSVKKSGDARAMELDDALASLKGRIDGMKKAVSEISDREQEFAAFMDSGKIAAALGALLLAFDENYARLKRRAGVLDFSDLEHKCLELLSLPHVRDEVRARYKYVFIDEYQDVNPVQEKILSLVAGENVFMVGDAKQSIYGFRGCSAAFFTLKFALLQKTGRALTLNGNFRSCANVLDAVNDLFSQAMTEKSCSIDYKGTAIMRAGSSAQEGGEVHIEFVPEPSEAEEKERGVYSVAENLDTESEDVSPEGALIADLVLQELTKKRKDPVLGEVQNGYGDIVVLTRSKKDKMENIVRELVRRGIPVAASAEVNICDYPEVKTLISVLKYLDNGLQDIPLASSLKSAMGNLTDGELAKIRLNEPKGTFCAACEKYAALEDETADKLRAFFALCERLRIRSAVCGAAEILTDILTETGMELKLLAQPCGAEKVRRVNRLCAACEDLSVSEFLDKLKSGGNKIGFSESGGENAVRVMTMHASKGLEFPVVIVAGMNAPFSGEDLKGILFDDEWGFAPEAYDFENYTSSETILRAAVRNRLRHKRAEDEMRILYVALTRAKSTLHMIFSKEKAYDDDETKSAGSFADFVDLSRLADRIAPVFGSELQAPSPRVLTAGETDEETKRAMLDRYCRSYEYEASVSLPVKTSASAILKRRAERSDTENIRTQEEFYASDADARTGTAYHAFLERADFGADAEAESARLCAELAADGFEVDGKKGAQILKQPIFSQLKGYELFREREFLLAMPANALFETKSQDEVLVQGVIDLMAVKGKECVIVDYKYSSHDAARLLADYTPQLKIYAEAAKKSAGVESVSAYILNILRGFVVRVPLGKTTNDAENGRV